MEARAYARFRDSVREGVKGTAVVDDEEEEATGKGIGKGKGMQHRVWLVGASLEETLHLNANGGKKEDK